MLQENIFSVTQINLIKACASESPVLGVEDVTIKEIRVSTVPQVLLQLAMRGVRVCVSVCECMHSMPYTPSQHGTDRWIFAESGF